MVHTAFECFIYICKSMPGMILSMVGMEIFVKNNKDNSLTQKSGIYFVQVQIISINLTYFRVTWFFIANSNLDIQTLQIYPNCESVRLAKKEKIEKSRKEKGPISFNISKVEAGDKSTRESMNAHSKKDSPTHISKHEK